MDNLNFKDYLFNTAQEFEINLNNTNLDEFEFYKNFLLEYNTKVNLTAITEFKDIAVKHFIDSLSVIKFCDIKQNSKLIDIGTGAGFPGVPIKIFRKDINLTLLDSLNKRIVFLEKLIKKLNLEANLIHGRAEEKARDILLRDSFDVVVSRAVASLNILSEYCLPFVKPGGLFISMKGSNNIDEEISLAKNAISVLGAEFVKKISFILPDESKRNIIIIKKLSSTPTKYPRTAINIKRKSL